MIDIFLSIERSPCNMTKMCARSPGNRMARENKSEDETASKEDEKAIRLIVSAPGVQPSDLKVTILESTLSIKGETKRGDTLFAVDKQMAVPRLADTDTAECTHADGIVTITMRRKDR